MKICWGKKITLPFHFDHLPTWVAKYLHYSKDSESAKNTFLGVRLPQTYSSEKKPKNLSFLFESVLKLELHFKVNFILNVWPFWDLLLPIFGLLVYTFTFL